MKKLSIYIHIPFCKSKCNYCSFYSIPILNSVIAGAANQSKFDSHCEISLTSGQYKSQRLLCRQRWQTAKQSLSYNPADFENYASLLIKETEIMSEKFPRRNSLINTIYFGGGTPSLMPVVFFRNILEFLDKNFKITDDAEITVEINPESGNLEKLSALKSLGINRLSIGAQSFNGGALKTAGRIHNKNDIYNAVNNAKKAGFGNISLDLIIGLPGQTENIFYNDAREILGMEPVHISAYMLSIEKGTKFYEIYGEKNGGGFIPEEKIAGYYEILCELLAKKSYIHYEISNFSKAGYESRHNLNYWKRGEYLGLGPSASSFFKTEDGKEIRKTNVSDLDKYANNVLKKTDSEHETGLFEILTEKDKINEEIFLSLRTNSGINANRLSELAGSEVINSLIKEGFMQNFKENITLTLKGMLLSSEIFARIMI
ncbi:MAG: radical SAM family heme chaperone HemW [bacterium]